MGDDFAGALLPGFSACSGGPACACRATVCHVGHEKGTTVWRGMSEVPPLVGLDWG